MEHSAVDRTSPGQCVANGVVFDDLRAEPVVACRVPIAELTEYMTRQVGMAQREVQVALPGGVDVVRYLRVNRSEHVLPVRRGVRARLLCDLSMLTTAGGAEELHFRVAEGVEVRIHDQVTSWSVVIDGAVAVVPAQDGRVGHGLAISHGSLVDLIAEAYESTWRHSVDPAASFLGHAMPVQVGLVGGAAKPTPPLAVLKSLEAGLTDETAARSLSMSVRTYRRHVAELMKRLGARSRFEAGCRARDRNWI